MQLTQQGILLSGSQPQNPFEVNLENTVFVVFDIGQSNAVGRATGDRIFKLTEDVETPANVRYFWKNSYLSADDGNIVIALDGSSHTQEPDVGNTGMTGSYFLLAARLTRASPNPVYVIMMGDGGTALKQNLTSPDWYEGSSGECFQIAFSYFYPQGYTKIAAEQPGKNIVPIICWHQGESDSLDADGTSGYSTRFLASGRFVESMRASHASLASAYLLMCKLYYTGAPAEATINAVFQSLADSSQYADTIDVSDVSGLLKQDLTTDQKGGVPTAGSDDLHFSYLGQIAKADRYYAKIKARFFPFANDAEYLVNSAFNTASLGTTGVRIQGSRSKVTTSTYSTVTAVTNDFSTGTFSAITNIKFKLIRRKGVLQWLSGVNGRIISSAAIGTTLFANATGFSISLFMKPRSGTPAGNMVLFHDIQNTSAANNSRILLLLRPTGVLAVSIAIGGTLVTFDTDSAVFSAGVQVEKHVALTFANGGNINMYVDKALIKTVSMATINTSSYVNNTNAFVIGANRTGVSSLSAYYEGDIREFVIHTGVIYSQADVNNLYMN